LSRLQHTMRVPQLVWAAWRGLRGVERSRRFAALLVVLLAASVLQQRRRRRRRRGGSARGSARSSKRRSAAEQEGGKVKEEDENGTLPDEQPSGVVSSSAAGMAAGMAAGGAVLPLSAYVGFLLNRAGHWGAEMTRRLAGAIVRSAMEVSRKSRSAAAGAASATQAIWEDTRTLVQKRAADAFASSVEKRLDSMLDVVGEQVKQRMKDEDMPAFVLTAIEETVDTILPDIKDEFYRRTLEVRDAYLSPALTARRRRAMRASRRSPAARRAGGRLMVGGTKAMRAVDAPKTHTTAGELNNNNNKKKKKNATPARRTLTFGNLGNLNQAGGGSNRDGDDLTMTTTTFAGHHHHGKQRAAAAAATATTTATPTAAAMPSSAHYMWRFEHERTSCIRNCLCVCCHPQSRVGRHVRRFLDASRAWVLYTLSPYDRSIWWSIKNPRWLALTAVGMVPYVGQLFWLLVFFLKNKRDEYQLIDFITGFQMARFVGQGCGFLLYGCAKYYLCVGRIPLDGAEACAAGGPSLSVYGVCFFTLQIVIVWVAFFMLPWSKRPELTPDVRQAHSRFGATVCVDLPRLPSKHRHRRDTRSADGWLSSGGGSDRVVEAEKYDEDEKEQHGGRRGRGAPRSTFFGDRGSDSLPPIHAFVDEDDDDGDAAAEADDYDTIYVYDEDGGIVQDEQHQGVRMWPWASAAATPRGGEDGNGRERASRRISAASRVIIARRGGQLTKMFWYTSTAVVLVTAAVVVALFSDGGWRLGQTLFWIRTTYCLTLFPFIIFKLPMMNPLLTHSHKTGYDSRGRTCLQKANIGKPLAHRLVKSWKRPQKAAPAVVRRTERKTPKSRVSLKRAMRHRLELRRPPSLSVDR
jgi:hypothetical protein